MDTSFLEQDLEQLRAGAVERLTAATDGFVRWAERVRDPQAPFRMRWAAGFAICVDLLGIQRETGWRGAWRYRHANDDTAYKRLGAEVRAALA